MDLINQNGITTVLGDFFSDARKNVVKADRLDPLSCIKKGKERKYEEKRKEGELKGFLSSLV